jgi:hypothetical protein
MVFETQKAERTWFVTLTLSAKARADMDRTVPPGPYEGEPVELRKAREFVLFLWVRDYLKRVRFHFDQSGDGAKLRYFAVTEPHQDGIPHMHMLMHTSSNITKAILRKAKWGHGYVDARLADVEASRYLAKYLTKTGARVRASHLYGKPQAGHLPEPANDNFPSSVPNGSTGEAIERHTTDQASPEKAHKGTAESSDTVPAVASGSSIQTRARSKRNGKLAKASAPEGLPEPDPE